VVHLRTLRPGGVNDTERIQAFDQYIRPYLQRPPLLVIVSGPAGVGKDSVVQCLGTLGHPFHFVVTTTDRPPRPGEVDGVDYDFVTTEEFRRMIEADELLEHADVYGQLKGVPKRQIQQALASGRDVVMRLDVTGAATIRRRVPGMVGIFLMPPSLEALIGRLRNRRTDTPEQIARRIAVALEELKRADEFDYVVVNHEGRLEETARQVLAIMKAERCRTTRRPVSL